MLIWYSPELCTENLVFYGTMHGKSDILRNYARKIGYSTELCTENRIFYGTMHGKSGILRTYARKIGYSPELCTEKSISIFHLFLIADGRNNRITVLKFKI